MTLVPQPLKRGLFALAAAVCLLLASPAHAEPGDELTVSVLTFGPGDHPFFKFGHNAILVRDARSRRDAVFNFGTFAFDSPWLIVDFFKGKLKYWLSVQSLAGTVAAYQRENRTIDEQELDLAPADRKAIYDALRKNALPENKYYKYDYYRDNCSTRVRDAVDRTVHGRVHDVSRAKADFTWRGHTLRLTADSIFVYLGLDAAMGDFIDKPIDQWDEMFLPSKLQESLRRATIDNVCPPDQAPGSCGTHPLVKVEKHLLTADRAPLRAAPPRWFFPFLVLGAIVGGGTALLGRVARRKHSKAARVAVGVILAFFGLTLGFLGCLFTFFWVATDHQVAWHNENILQCPPWTIALVVYGGLVAAGRPRGTEVAYKLASAAAVAALLGVVLKALPWFDQDNAQIFALTVPLWLGLAAAIQPLRSSSVKTENDPQTSSAAAEALPSPAMQFAAVMAELERKGSEARRAAAKKRGATLPAFGTTVATRRAIARRVGVDQPLARQLWASANHDARSLATLVADAAQMSPVELELWASDLGCGALADSFAALAARSPSVKNHLLRWLSSSCPWNARAGWSVVAVLAAREDEAFCSLHEDLHRSTFEDAPAEVRPAMIAAMTAIRARPRRRAPKERGSQVVARTRRSRAG